MRIRSRLRFRLVLLLRRVRVRLCAGRRVRWRVGGGVVLWFRGRGVGWRGMLLLGVRGRSGGR
jgi:hypothetical protein